MGPVSLVVIPPLRRMAGDQDPPRIPLTYPSECFRSFHFWVDERQNTGCYDRGLEMKRESESFNLLTIMLFDMAVPKGPRKIPEGFDD